MHFKKLFTAILFVLSSFTGVVQAQTNYNFDLFMGNPQSLSPLIYSGAAYGITGTGINNNGTLSSLHVTSFWTNNVTYDVANSSTSSASIVFNPIPSQTVIQSGITYSSYTPITGPTSLSDLTFTANGINYSFGTTGTMGLIPASTPPAGTYVTLIGNGVGPNLLPTANYAQAVQVWSSTSGGAPEIDGSLAPKVGFLLGCLFLMFGRKKQNSEPLISA